MKKIILHVLIFIGCYANGYTQSLKILLQPGIKDIMQDICFVNENTGWMVGASGYIYKTTNAGTDWSAQNSNTTDDLQKVFFINENTGWISSLYGKVLKTTDGGETWNSVSLSTLVPKIVINTNDALYFTDSNNGFVIAGQSKSIYLFKTTDGGITWAICDSLKGTTARRWYDIDFRNANKGVIVGDKKDIEKITTDGGNTWAFSTAISDTYFASLKTVKWLTDNNVIALGEGSEYNGVPTPIYKSTDAGLTWNKSNQSLTVNKYDRIKCSYFKDSINGVALGSNGFGRPFVINTTDGGDNWSVSVPDLSFGFSSVSGYGNNIFGLGTSSHLVKSTDFGTTWKQVSLFTPTSINKIQFIGKKGIAMTRNGDIYLNSDGTGQSWEYISNTGLNECYSMNFINANTGFILKDNRHIVKTTDGGYTWKTVLQPVDYNSHNKSGGIAFGDENTGYAWMSVNDYSNYYIYKTTDQGETWNQVSSLTGPGYISGTVLAFDASTAIALGPDKWAYRTTDGGATWDTAAMNNFPDGFAAKDFEEAVKIDANTALAVGDQFMCITSDKGATWNYIDHGITGIDTSFYTVSFYDNKLGYVGCFDGTILRTTDGGSTWTKNDSLLNQYYLYCSTFNSSGKILFGTSNGYILGEETPTGINDKNNSTISSYELKQNYPNPFNPSTTIEFNIPKSGHVTLKLFDVLGNEVKTILNNELNAGTHSVRLNAERLASGVYYYKLTVNAYSLTKKLILLK